MVAFAAAAAVGPDFLRKQALVHSFEAEALEEGRNDGQGEHLADVVADVVCWSSL